MNQKENKITEIKNTVNKFDRLNMAEERMR
jgi:hypothetical protein